MLRNIVRLFPLFLGAALAACSGDDSDTIIDVVVTDRDPGLPDRVDRIEVRVAPVSPPGSRIDVFSTEPEYDGARLAPWSVRARPQSASHAGRVVYSFRAVAFVGSAEYANVQARLAFIRGGRLILPLRFDAACVRRTCPEEQTCSAGVCVDSHIEPCFLATDRGDPSCTDSGPPLDAFVPPDLGPPVDAFVPPDLGPPPDAFVPPDSGPPLDAFVPPDSGPPLDAFVPPDLGPPLDAFVPDTFVPDAFVPSDSGPPDAGPRDMGAADACMPHMEMCNGRDDDCDGMIDEGLRETLYRDSDDDGFGDPDNSMTRCPEDGWVENSDDCYDDDDNVRPTQTRFFDVPHGGGDYDYDCDGTEEMEPLPGPRDSCRTSLNCPSECMSPPYDADGACGADGWDYGASPDCGQFTELIECVCDGADLPVSDFCCDGRGAGPTETLGCR